MSLANTLVMGLAMITNDTRRETGGTIVRISNGALIGNFRANVRALIDAVVPGASAMFARALPWYRPASTSIRQID